MSFIRKKIVKSGKAYAYEITAVWDSEKKQSRSVSKYIGSYDEEGNLILKGTKKIQSRQSKDSDTPKAKLIQDFGDGFLVLESIKKSVIYSPLESALIAKPELLSLMSYRLASPGPMYNCALWAKGNVVGTLEGDCKLSSQDISRLLGFLGEEELQREFFKKYLASSNANLSTKNVIIDATSMPCQNSSDFNAFGYSNGGVEEQFRFHCVLPQETKKPLFYRYVPGNIADISTLISSKQIPEQEVLASYYNRQSIEQVFGFVKSDLDLLPIRCHSDKTIRGYLFLQFLLLIVFIEIREKLASHFTVEQALITTRALKCKIYDDKLIIQELSKNQKKIFELLELIVPKKPLGI